MLLLLQGHVTIPDAVAQKQLSSAMQIENNNMQARFSAPVSQGLLNTCLHLLARLHISPLSMHERQSCHIMFMQGRWDTKKRSKTSSSLI